ncbi:hypothetical protein DIPPA_23720 [Diplonema papillatum]|nr:hypothetical protein DIPPA_23720 [Diplonema papillatum]
MSCFRFLEENQQLLVTTFSGVRYVVNGPGCVSLNPCSSSETRSAMVLNVGQYAVIVNDEFGTKRTVYGPCVDWLGPRESVAARSNCPQLDQTEYLTIRDGTNGHTKNIVGPILYQPGAYDEFGPPKSKS